MEAKRIFLSHKSADKPLVNEYKEIIQTLGFEPWFDDDDIDPSGNLERELLKGFNQSCAAIFFVTHSFVDENWLETEINYAINEKRKKKDRFSIITIRFSNEAGVMPEVSEILKLHCTFIDARTPFYVLRKLLRALPIGVGEIHWARGSNSVVEAAAPVASIRELESPLSVSVEQAALSFQLNIEASALRDERIFQLHTDLRIALTSEDERPVIIPLDTCILEFEVPKILPRTRIRELKLIAPEHVHARVDFIGYQKLCFKSHVLVGARDQTASLRAFEGNLTFHITIKPIRRPPISVSVIGLQSYSEDRKVTVWISNIHSHVSI